MSRYLRKYDALGNLIRRTDTKGQITAYAYDLQGRLVTNAYYPSDASYPSSPSKTVSFAYDAHGRMTAWTVAGGGDPGSSGSFTYDDTNRTHTVTLNYGAFSKTYTWENDGFGRKTAFTYPTPSLPNTDTLTLHYSYDAQGRLTGIEIPGEGAVAFGADEAGLPDGVTMPGGTRKTFGYDGWQAMTTNLVADPAGNAVLFRAYSRNLAGNILGQNTEQGNYAYGYDRIDQLTNVNISAYTGPAGIATNESFAYDPMGNRLVSTVNREPGTENSVYSVNSLNQYSEISNLESQITLQYDLNGNLTNQAWATGANEYTWDIENRLIGYKRTDTNGATSASYTYDPFGRRIMKYVSSTSNPSYTNYYCYADEGLIGEYDSTGNEICSYGYTPGSMWMNNPVFLRQPEGVSTGYYWFVNDHLGAPQKLVANNGSVVWSMAQDAFGRAVVSSNSTIICNLRFSSQYYDPEFGLHYNTMRYYDPVSGRYLSEDPIGENESRSLYLFVGNTPVNITDSLGLWEENGYTGGKFRKLYKSDCKDTVEDLANKLLLSPNDFQKWLHAEDNGRLPSTAYEKIDRIRKFSVPNTVAIDIGAGIGSPTDAIVLQMALGFYSASISSGYQVDFFMGSQFSMGEEDLIKYAFFGHGAEGVILPGNVGYSAGRYSHHKLAYVEMIACNSYMGESGWKQNVSAKGTLRTVQGWFPTFFIFHSTNGKD